MAWGAVACFIIEYLGLFAGVSIFYKGHSCAYILLHFVGTILTALYYTNVRRRRQQREGGGQGSAWGAADAKV